MYSNHTPRRARLGTVNRDQLAALLEVLRPYRAEPITPAIMELAARVAHLESMEAAQ